MEQVVRFRRASVSEGNYDRSRSWAHHYIEFVEPHWGSEHVSNQGLDGMIPNETFHVYTVAEVDQKISQTAQAMEAANVQLKSDIMKAIGDLPAKILPQEKLHELTQAVTQIVQERLSAQIEALRAELKDEIAREVERN